VNLQVNMDAPTCNSRFLVGSSVSFTSSIKVTSVAPYSYTWTSTRVRCCWRCCAHARLVGDMCVWRGTGALGWDVRAIALDCWCDGSSLFFRVPMSHSMSFARARGIPEFKIVLGRGKDGRVGEGLADCRLPYNLTGSLLSCIMLPLALDKPCPLLQQGSLNSTASTVSVSTLDPGTHIVSLEVRDANSMVARAATTVTIGYNGGAPCSTGDTCLSGYCTG
jgi:hypothetical protein